MASLDWSQSVVVVTGASAGIGEGFAREVARRGARVVLAARRGEKLAQIARELGGEARALGVVTDATRRGDVDSLLDSAVKHFGAVDVWVNNAGRGITRSFDQLTDEDIDAMIRDNVKTALYGMQAAMRHFRTRSRGRLVNVSSMLGRVPFFGPRAAYSASKGALNVLTDSLRLEISKELPDIVVTTVLPGLVATDFGANALNGGVDSRTIPGAQSIDEVATIMADGIAAGRQEIYSRPEFVDRVLGRYRELAGG